MINQIYSAMAPTPFDLEMGAIFKDRKIQGPKSGFRYVNVTKEVKSGGLKSVVVFLKTNGFKEKDAKGVNAIFMAKGNLTIDISESDPIWIITPVIPKTARSALTPKQEQLDLNNDGKIDAEDLKNLREGKTKETSSLKVIASRLASALDTVVVKDANHLKKIIKESALNADLNHLDVSKVKDMSNMFYESKFNGDISKWDVSKVKDMSLMFYESKFNGDISKWDVSNVIDMSHMFADSSFNKDISKWKVHKVRTMEGIFDGSKFKGDLSNWAKQP